MRIAPLSVLQVDVPCLSFFFSSVHIARVPEKINAAGFKAVLLGVFFSRCMSCLSVAQLWCENLMVRR